MRWLALSLLLALAAPAWAATKWIDVSGTGTGAANGADVNNQCAGVGDADCIGGNLPAGSTAYLCGTLTGAGLTAPVAGSAGNVTIYDGSCPGGTPANITATSGSAAWLANKAYTTNTNMTLAYPGSKPLQINASNLTVSGNTIVAGQDGITLTTPTTLSSLTISGNTITGMTRYGIQSIYSGSTTQSLTDLTISGNTIEGNANSGILLQCGVASTACTLVRVTIDSNIVTRNGNTGIVVQDCYDGADIVGSCADVTTNTPSDFKDVRITGNTVQYQTGGGGIALYGCIPETGFTHGRCVVADNDSSYNTGVTGGIDLFNSVYPSVYRNRTNGNICTSIDANGILVDYGNRYVRVWGNEASGNEGCAGVDNSGVGVMCLQCIDVEIRGNVGTGNKAGLFFSGGSFAESGIVVEGNSFADSADYGVYFDSSQDASSTALRNNVLSGPGICVNVESGGNVNTEDYNSLSCATRAAYNSVGWSNGSNSQTSDPMLAGGDGPGAFCPRPGSPLLAAGTYIGAYATGYAAEDLGKPPVIGARRSCDARRAVATRRALPDRRAP